MIQYHNQAMPIRSYKLLQDNKWSVDAVIAYTLIGLASLALVITIGAVTAGRLHLAYGFFVAVLCSGALASNLYQQERKGRKILSQRQYIGDPDNNDSHFQSSIVYLQAGEEGAKFRYDARIFQTTASYSVYDMAYVPQRSRSYIKNFYTIYEAKLGRSLSHTIFESVHAGDFRVSSLYDKAQSFKVSELNGEFRVYTPLGYNQDGTAALTPAVLSAILNLRSYGGLEIIGDRLFCYASELLNQRQVSHMVQLAEELRNQLGTVKTHDGNYLISADATARQLLPAQSKWSNKGKITLIFAVACLGLAVGLTPYGDYEIADSLIFGPLAVLLSLISGVFYLLHWRAKRTRERIALSQQEQSRQAIPSDPHHAKNINPQPKRRNSAKNQKTP